MDRETKHELDTLLRDLTEALDEVRFAVFDAEAEVAAWRKVQVSGWRLNELLPGPGRHAA